MAKSETMGMQTFDTDIYRLYQSGKISREEALKNADSENNMRLKIDLGDDGSSQAASALG
jgi:twitching motility protein PilU